MAYYAGATQVQHGAQLYSKNNAFLHLDQMQHAPINNPARYRL
jgi:hypothetical protein